MSGPKDNPNYQPSPQPNRIYSGPDVPTVYDPKWQYFTNLTAAQIAWFQARPEWQNFVSYVSISPKTAMAATPVSVVSGALSVAAAHKT